MNELPSIEDVVVQTAAVLVNLAAKAIGEENYDEAKQGIDAARALLPLTPEDVQKQLRDPLAQLQMSWVQASKSRAGTAPESAPESAPEPEPEKPPSRLWTPPGA